jgi:hypothetical protein
MKLLFITNCQGPVLAKWYLERCSEQFRQRYSRLPFVEVQKLRAGDDVAGLVEQADVIIAQPVTACPVDAARHQSLVASGKRVIFMTALHFNGVQPLTATSVWKDRPYPFGQTEDIALAAAFVSGLSPEAAERAYHDVPLLTLEELERGIEGNIAGFRKRETQFGTDVRMSDYYADTWRTTRLHHVKSHPTAAPYFELMRRVADVLELTDVDASLARAQGNDQFALPLKRWVLDTLGCAIDDDPEMGHLETLRVPFRDIIAALWRAYGAAGAEEVAALHGANPLFRRAVEAYS